MKGHVIFLRNVLRSKANCKEGFIMLNNSYANRLKESEGQCISSTRFGNIPMFWKSACGCEVIGDSGEKYLDCTSSYGVMGIGYANPKMICEINKQVKLINHTMCEIYPHEPYLLALENIKTTLNREHDQVIMTVTGSDAIDVALKLAYRYTGKRGVIAFEGAFHGQTLSALSVSGQNAFRKPFAPIISANTTFVPFPNLYRNEFESEEKLLENCISKIKNILSNSENVEFSIGAIVVEPMQNAAGYIIPPTGFLREIRNICNEYKIIMIVDEIFTGFGRCGKWLMSDYEDVKADIVCVGKVMTSGFPAAACLASKEIMESLDYSGLVPLHGSTFTGQAISCAAINSTINILKEDDLIEKSYKNGVYLREQLNCIFKNNPFIGDIRGKGSATLLEFVSNRDTKVRDSSKAQSFFSHLLENKIISLVSGLPYCNCVSLCIPFVMSQTQLDYLLEICLKFNEQYQI